MLTENTANKLQEMKLSAKATSGVVSQHGFRLYDSV